MITRSDWLVLLCASLFVIALYPLFWNTSSQVAQQAELSLPGGEKKHLDLGHDGSYHFAGRLGESVIEVAQGQVRFVSSPCNGKQCIHAGWLHRAGQFAACLPNGISLLLVGGEQFDSINF